MAIQTQLQLQLQRGDFVGFPLDCGGGFNQFHLNLQQEELILLQQKFPEKFSQKILQNHLHHQWNPTQYLDSHGVSFIAEMETQQIDQYLKSQSETLRSMLREKMNLQIESLLKKIETRIRILLRQKDEEIARAKKRRIELEQFLTRLKMENQERQRAVQENEAMVVSLNNSLEQMREKLSSSFNNGVNDAESMNGDAIGRRKKTMICRNCNSRMSCVLFWPCRHLCSCKPCEKVLDSCPICNTTKKASIESVIF